MASGDGAGGRADIRVVQDQVGVLTGEVFPGTWRDPPLEGIWLDTYERLAASYPEEVPRRQAAKASPPVTG